MDLDLIRQSLDLARKHGFAEVELALGGDSFTARLDPSASRPKAKFGAPVEEVEPISASVEVKAGLVGYFRNGKIPLEVGIDIGQGEVLGVITALGIANDIESPASGQVVEVLVEQNQAVEYGQVLARIKP